MRLRVLLLALSSALWGGLAESLPADDLSRSTTLFAAPALESLPADHFAQSPPPTTQPVPTEPLPQQAEEVRSPLAAPGFDRKPIGGLGIDIRPPAGELPPDAAREAFAASAELPVVDRAHGETLFFWTAPNLGHRPLYFEQRYVERYGYSFGRLQPIASGAQFFGTVPLLPWKMLQDPPRRFLYQLGQARPDGVGARR